MNSLRKLKAYALYKSEHRGHDLTRFTYQGEGLWRAQCKTCKNSVVIIAPSEDYPLGSITGGAPRTTCDKKPTS